MTVEFRNLQSGSGVKPVTSFSDSLQGVDDPPYMGQPWAPLLVPGGTGVTGALVDAQVNKSGAGVTFGGGGLLVPFMLFYPATITVPVVLAKSITRGVFSQAKLATFTPGVSIGSGPAVMFQPDPKLLYVLEASITGGGARDALLGRVAASIFTTLVLNTFSVVVGDVIRLECTKNGSDNVLKSYQNGVLKNTTTDVGAGVDGGLFGMFYEANNVGSETWTNYSGGIL